MTTENDCYNRMLLYLDDGNPDPEEWNTITIITLIRKWDDECPDWKRIIRSIQQDKLIVLKEFEETIQYKMTPQGSQLAIRVQEFTSDY